MSTYDPPGASHRIGPALRAAGNSAFDYALPALRVAKESVTGLGIVGLEAALSGALKIAEMIQVGYVVVEIPTASAYLYFVHRR